MIGEWVGVDGAGAIAPAMEGTGQQGAVAPRWWNPLDSVAIDARIAAGGYWAWRAENTPGSPWGLGPANYAASRVSVEGAALLLPEGNGIVPWAALTGWGFVAAALQYFDTTLVPGTDWVAFIQFANVLSTIPAGSTFGVDRLANRAIEIRPNTAGRVFYYNGGNVAPNPAMPTGNAAVVDRIAYRNAVNDGVIGPWTIPATETMFLGCKRRNANPQNHITGNILSFLVCDDATAFGAPDITAIAGLPAGSMHNL